MVSAASQSPVRVELYRDVSMCQSGQKIAVFIVHWLAARGADGNIDLGLMPLGANSQICMDY